jgi:fructose-1,6-bisphosphatase
MKKNNRTERFELKISTEDKERLRRLAEEHGVTMADYVANCINARPMVRLETKQNIQKIKYELSMIGSNLNQIAHALNGTYYRYPEDAKKLEEALTELKKVIDKIREAY